MTTKRFSFKAPTLCAGGTLLVLGSFLTLNLAGCGGGGGGGIITPTAIPGTTPTAVPVNLSIQLQLSDGTNASGGSVTLTSTTGRVYTGQASGTGVVRLNGVVPSSTPYNLVFVVRSANGQNVSTTRAITIAAGGSANVVLRQGDTGTENPFSITGRVLLNPTFEQDPDNNPATDNCAAIQKGILDEVVITVIDLNATNGPSIIAQTTRTAQANTTPLAQQGLYSVSIPYRPRSFEVRVTGTGNTPFNGVSRATSFPQNALSVSGVDACTNLTGNAPVAVGTTAPTSTPTAIPTTFAVNATATAIAGATATAIAGATATAAPIQTATAAANATAVAAPIQTSTAIANATATAVAAPGATATAAVNATATAVAGVFATSTAAAATAAAPTPTGTINPNGRPRR